MKPLPRNGEVIITIKNGYVEKWEPVRHGRWLKEHIDGQDCRSFVVARCSNCKYYFPTLFLPNLAREYCPRCGARMEVE